MGYTPPIPKRKPFPLASCTQAEYDAELAKRAYERGQITLAEFERQIEQILQREDDTPPRDPGIRERR